jgi:hypothetical protein
MNMYSVTAFGSSIETVRIHCFDPDYSNEWIRRADTLEQLPENWLALVETYCQLHIETRALPYALNLFRIHAPNNHSFFAERAAIQLAAITTIEFPVGWDNWLAWGFADGA